MKQFGSCIEDDERRTQQMSGHEKWRTFYMWTNLTVINIDNFVEINKRIDSYLLIAAAKELNVEFDKEHRGISVNTQDPIILDEICKRLRTIDGLVITKIETIENKY